MHLHFFFINLYKRKGEAVESDRSDNSDSDSDSDRRDISDINDSSTVTALAVV